MNISELIAKLERLRTEHGDVPVIIRINDFFGDTGDVTDVEYMKSGVVKIDSC